LRRPSAKAQVSSQRRGSSSVHHNAVSPRFYGAGSQQMGMFRSRTADYDDGDMLEIQRTGSGGLLFGDMLGIRRTAESGAGLLLKNKNFEERQKVSQARATELSDLYELSEQKDTELNRNAIIKHKVTCAPSMGGHLMTAKHAAINYYKIEKDHATRTRGKDPLLTAHEIKERERQATMARRKADIKKRNRGPTEITATSSSEDASNRVGSSPKVVSSYDKDDLLPDTVGFEIVGGAGNGGCSMVPTVAKLLPNRPAKKTGYRAANGVYYDVPNLC
jgi:hypothetical protein